MKVHERTSRTKDEASEWERLIDKDRETDRGRDVTAGSRQVLTVCHVTVVERLVRNRGNNFVSMFRNQRRIYLNALYANE